MKYIPEKPAITTSRSERREDYDNVVCNVNNTWRVIVCKHDIQWILQISKAEGGHGRAWRGRSYHTLKATLIRDCARLCGPHDPEASLLLEVLPDKFQAKGKCNLGITPPADRRHTDVEGH